MLLGSGMFSYVLTVGADFDQVGAECMVPLFIRYLSPFVEFINNVGDSLEMGTLSSPEVFHDQFNTLVNSPFLFLTSGVDILWSRAGDLHGLSFNSSQLGSDILASRHGGS